MGCWPRRWRQVKETWNGPHDYDLMPKNHNASRLVRSEPPRYAACFDFAFKLKLIALHAQRSDSGYARGVTCSQEPQSLHWKHSRSSLNAVTTGSKSFL